METTGAKKRRVRIFWITAVMLVLVMVAALCASAPAREARADEGNDYSITKRKELTAETEYDYVVKGVKKGQYKTETFD